VGLVVKVRSAGVRHKHPVNVIQAHLGHTSLSTTSTYLPHIAPKQAVDAGRARTWTP
jgi:integrase